MHKACTAISVNLLLPLICSAQQAPIESGVPAGPSKSTVLVPITSGTPTPSDDAAARLKALVMSGAVIKSNSVEATISPSGAANAIAIERLCPLDKEGLTDGYTLFTYSLSSDAAASLSYFAKADISATDKVILYQFMWYKDLVDADGTVSGRCGAGVVLALKVSNLQGNITLSLPVLAATAQLGQTSISYKLGTFGLSGLAIDKAIPNARSVGKFDTESYANLLQSIDTVQQSYAAGSGLKVTPRLVAASVPSITPSLDKISAIRITAMRQIAQGKTCKEAKGSVPSRDANSDGLVEETYASLTGGKECGYWPSPPSNDAQKQQRDLLQSYGIPLK